jgi:hypothetical protein
MLGNFILETTVNPGTSATVQLAGAATGRVGFLDVFGSGAAVFYTMEAAPLFEVGIGTVTAGSPDTLSRDTVLSNSAGTTARLNFTGTTRVYCAPPAERAVYTDGAGDLQGITAAKLRDAAGATTVGGALLTAADAAAGRSAIGAAAIAGDTFTGAVRFGAADHYIELSGSNRIWNWDSGSDGRAWYDGSVFRVTIGGVNRIGVNAGGLTVANTLTVQGAAGVVAANACKAFVSFDGATGAIRGTAFNVSSVTDNNTGDFTLNFAAALASANYAAVANLARTTGSNPFDRNLVLDSAVYSTTQLRVITGFGLATYEDQAIVNVHVFGG